MIGRLVLVVLAALLVAPTMVFAQGQMDVHWSKLQQLQVPDGGTMAIHVLRFTRDVTSQEVVDEMRKHGARPAYARHCIAYAKGAKGLFACLGSAKVRNGQKLVPVRFTNLGLEETEFLPWDGLWISSFTFLAIPNPIKKRP